VEAGFNLNGGERVRLVLIGVVTRVKCPVYPWWAAL